MASLKPTHYQNLCRILEKEGWTLSRQKGDHLIYKRSGALRPIVIPMYKNIPIFIIQNNLRTAGISREKYFELLTKT